MASPGPIVVLCIMVGLFGLAPMAAAGCNNLGTVCITMTLGTGASNYNYRADAHASWIGTGSLSLTITSWDGNGPTSCSATGSCQLSVMSIVHANPTCTTAVADAIALAASHSETSKIGCSGGGTSDCTWTLPEAEAALKDTLGSEPVEAIEDMGVCA